jgi:hypothetical protein
MQEDTDVPLHMDIWTRNERLYQYLLGMGLVAHAIRSESDPSRIEGIYVSAGFMPAETEARARRIIQEARPNIPPPHPALKRHEDGVVIELMPRAPIDGEPHV